MSTAIRYTLCIHSRLVRHCSPLVQWRDITTLQQVLRHSFSLVSGHMISLDHSHTRTQTLSRHFSNGVSYTRTVLKLFPPSTTLFSLFYFPIGASYLPPPREEEPRRDVDIITLPCNVYILPHLLNLSLLMSCYVITYSNVHIIGVTSLRSLLWLYNHCWCPLCPTTFDTSHQ